MAEIKINSETERTPEYWQWQRTLTANLRETKGRESEALEKARLNFRDAERSGQHEHAVNFLWEEYLIGKHLVMKGQDEATLKPFSKAINIAAGLYTMKNAASNADKYIIKHNLHNLAPRSHRFLGEIEMIMKRPKKAISHFEKGIKLFNQSEDSSVRVNSLEFSGFLAEALVLSGRISDGVELARETFQKYDIGDGEELKKRDYYTWAVWKSGCATKLSKALISKNKTDSFEGLNEMLDIASKILIFPNGQETWGDKNFNIRKEEIASVRSKIRP